jgi:hypothetical protein
LAAYGRKEVVPEARTKDEPAKRKHGTQ